LNLLRSSHARVTYRGMIAIAAVIGCAPGGVHSPSGAHLVVDADTVTTFDATLSQGEKWARIEVVYTPVSTSSRLTTSLRTTLAHQGTAAAEAGFVPDARMDATDGLVILNQNDREYEVVQALLDALMARGVSATPAPAEKATPFYAAAYTTAET